MGFDCVEEDGGRVHGLEVDGGGACAAGDEALLDLEGVFECACVVEVAEVAEGDEELGDADLEGLGDDEEVADEATEDWVGEVGGVEGGMVGGAGEGMTLHDVSILGYD